MRPETAATRRVWETGSSPGGAPGALGGQRPAGDQAMLGKHLSPGVLHGGHAQSCPPKYLALAAKDLSNIKQVWTLRFMLHSLMCLRLSALD